MSVEGRLARGKENYDKKRLMDNSETLEYIATLKPVKPVDPVKPVEVKIVKEKKNGRK